MDHLLLRSIFPNASKSVIAANRDAGDLAPEQPARIPERLQDETLAVVRRREGAVETRIIVRIECYRVRLQDPDNALLKPCIDQLRYSGLIPEDSPEIIRLEHDQIKVKTKAEEGTKITLIYP